jgi:hypothetical protein
MKFAIQSLSVLAAAGLLMGAMGAAPAIAAGKKAEKPKDPTIFQLIDADLKAIDKAIFGTPKKK